MASNRIVLGSATEDHARANALVVADGAGAACLLGGGTAVHLGPRLAAGAAGAAVGAAATVVGDAGVLPFPVPAAAGGAVLALAAGAAAAPGETAVRVYADAAGTVAVGTRRAVSAGGVPAGAVLVGPGGPPADAAWTAESDGRPFVHLSSGSGAAPATVAYADAARTRVRFGPAAASGAGAADPGAGVTLDAGAAGPLTLADAGTGAVRWRCGGGAEDGAWWSAPPVDAASIPATHPPTAGTAGVLVSFDDPVADPADVLALALRIVHRSGAGTEERRATDPVYLYPWETVRAVRPQRTVVWDAGIAVGAAPGSTAAPAPLGTGSVAHWTEAGADAADWTAAGQYPYNAFAAIGALTFDRLAPMAAPGGVRFAGATGALVYPYADFAAAAAADGQPADGQPAAVPCVRFAPPLLMQCTAFAVVAPVLQADGVTVAAGQEVPMTLLARGVSAPRFELVAQPAEDAAAAAGALGVRPQITVTGSVTVRGTAQLRDERLAVVAYRVAFDRLSVASLAAATSGEPVVDWAHGDDFGFQPPCPAYPEHAGTVEPAYERALASSFGAHSLFLGARPSDAAPTPAVGTVDPSDLVDHLRGFVCEVQIEPFVMADADVEARMADLADKWTMAALGLNDLADAAHDAARGALVLGWKPATTAAVGVHTTLVGTAAGTGLDGGDGSGGRTIVGGYAGSAATPANAVIVADGAGVAALAAVPVAERRLVCVGPHAERAAELVPAGATHVTWIGAPTAALAAAVPVPTGAGALVVADGDGTEIVAAAGDAIWAGAGCKRLFSQMAASVVGGYGAAGSTRLGGATDADLLDDRSDAVVLADGAGTAAFVAHGARGSLWMGPNAENAFDGVLQTKTLLPVKWLRARDAARTFLPAGDATIALPSGTAWPAPPGVTTAGAGGGTVGGSGGNVAVERAVAGAPGGGAAAVFSAGGGGWVDLGTRQFTVGTSGFAVAVSVLCATADPVRLIAFEPATPTAANTIVVRSDGARWIGEYNGVSVVAGGGGAVVPGAWQTVAFTFNNAGTYTMVVDGAATTVSNGTPPSGNLDCAHSYVGGGGAATGGFALTEVAAYNRYLAAVPLAAAVRAIGGTLGSTGYTFLGAVPGTERARDDPGLVVADGKGVVRLRATSRTLELGPDVASGGGVPPAMEGTVRLGKCTGLAANATPGEVMVANGYGVMQLVGDSTAAPSVGLGVCAAKLQQYYMTSSATVGGHTVVGSVAPASATALRPGTVMVSSGYDGLALFADAQSAWIGAATANATLPPDEVTAAAAAPQLWLGGRSVSSSGSGSSTVGGLNPLWWLRASDLTPGSTLAGTWPSALGGSNAGTSVVAVGTGMPRAYGAAPALGEPVAFVRMGTPGSVVNWQGHYLEFGAHTFAVPTKGFTAVMLVRFHTSTAGKITSIMDFGPSSQSNTHLSLSIDYDTSKFEMLQTSQAGPSDILRGSAVVVGKWHRVAYVMRNAQYVLVCDDVKYNKTPFEAVVNAVCNSCRVGRRIQGSSYYAPMDVSEFAVYDRALSDAEVSNVMAALKAPLSVTKAATIAIAGRATDNAAAAPPHLWLGGRVPPAPSAADTEVAAMLPTFWLRASDLTPGATLGATWPAHGGTGPDAQVLLSSVNASRPKAYGAAPAAGEPASFVRFGIPGVFTNLFGAYLDFGSHAFDVYNRGFTAVFLVRIHTKFDYYFLLNFLNSAVSNQTIQVRARFSLNMNSFQASQTSIYNTTEVVSGGPIVINQWHRVVCVLQKNTGKCVVDGVVYNKTFPYDCHTAVCNQCLIAGTGTANQYYANMDLGELLVFDRALSDPEIDTLMAMLNTTLGVVGRAARALPPTSGPVTLADARTGAVRWHCDAAGRTSWPVRIPSTVQYDVVAAGMGPRWWLRAADLASGPIGSTWPSPLGGWANAAGVGTAGTPVAHATSATASAGEPVPYVRFGTYGTNSTTDGNYLDLGPYTFDVPGRGFAVAALVRYHTAGNVWGRVIDFGYGAGADAGNLILTQYEGKWHARHHTAASAWTVGSAVVPGRWHRVILSVGGSALTLKCDDDAAVTTIGITSAAVACTACFVGRSWWGDYLANMDLAELLVFDRALSTYEIEAIEQVLRSGGSAVNAATATADGDAQYPAADGMLAVRVTTVPMMSTAYRSGVEVAVRVPPVVDAGLRAIADLPGGGAPALWLRARDLLLCDPYVPTPDGRPLPVGGTWFAPEAGALGGGGGATVHVAGAAAAGPTLFLDAASAEPFVRFGAGYVSAADGNYLDFGPRTFPIGRNGFTVVAAVRPWLHPHGGIPRIIEFAYGATQASYNVIVGILDESWFATIEVPGRVLLVGSRTTGEWETVAFVVDGTAMTLTTNGTATFTATNPAAPTDTVACTHCYVGRSFYPWDTYANMDLRELVVFDRALSAAEVRAVSQALAAPWSADGDVACGGGGVWARPLGRLWTPLVTAGVRPRRAQRFALLPDPLPTAAPTVVNGRFDADYTADFVSGAPAGWTEVREPPDAVDGGLALVAHKSLSFGSVAHPYGRQFCAVQSSTANTMSVEQAIDGFVAQQKYVLQFFAASRTWSGVGTRMTVTVDGVAVPLRRTDINPITTPASTTIDLVSGTDAATNPSIAHRYTGMFVAAGARCVLRFTNLSSGGLVFLFGDVSIAACVDAWVEADGPAYNCFQRPPPQTDRAVGWGRPPYVRNDCLRFAGDNAILSYAWWPFYHKVMGSGGAPGGDWIAPPQLQQATITVAVCPVPDAVASPPPISNDVSGMTLLCKGNGVGDQYIALQLIVARHTDDSPGTVVAQLSYAFGRSYANLRSTTVRSLAALRVYTFRVAWNRVSVFTDDDGGQHLDAQAVVDLPLFAPRPSTPLPGDATDAEREHELAANNQYDLVLGAQPKTFDVWTQPPAVQYPLDGYVCHVEIAPRILSDAECVAKNAAVRDQWYIDPPAPAFVNGTFQADTVVDTVLGYDPVTRLTGWKVLGSVSLCLSGRASGATHPDGYQVVALAQSASIAQTVGNFREGKRYTLSFLALGLPEATPPVVCQVLCNGTAMSVVGPEQPSGGTSYAFTATTATTLIILTATFTATMATSVFRFVNGSTTGSILMIGSVSAALA